MDVKPQNCLYSPEGRAVLADFGSSRMLKEAQLDNAVCSALDGLIESDTAHDTAQLQELAHRLDEQYRLQVAQQLRKVSQQQQCGSRSKAVRNATRLRSELQAHNGTPEYTAPELQPGNSKTMTGAADIWSLGCTAFELLTGVSPFADSDGPAWKAERWNIQRIARAKGSFSLKFPAGVDTNARQWLGAILESIDPGMRLGGKQPDHEAIIGHPFLTQACGVQGAHPLPAPNPEVLSEVQPLVAVAPVSNGNLEEYLQAHVRRGDPSEAWEIEGRFGFGEHGDLSVCVDTTNGRRCALKSLHKGAEKPLGREIQVMLEAKHPNLLPIYEVWQQDMALSVVMQLIEPLPGLDTADLFEYLMTNGQLRPEEVAKVAVQTESALQYLSTEHGSIHLDLRPENILIGSEGIHHIFITDFWVAHRYSQVYEEDGNSLQRAATCNVGNSDFAAPETTEYSQVGESRIASHSA